MTSTRIGLPASQNSRGILRAINQSYGAVDTRDIAARNRILEDTQGMLPHIFTFLDIAGWQAVNRVNHRWHEVRDVIETLTFLNTISIPIQDLKDLHYAQAHQNVPALTQLEIILGLIATKPNEYQAQILKNVIKQIKNDDLDIPKEKRLIPMAPVDLAPQPVTNQVVEISTPVPEEKESFDQRLFNNIVRDMLDLYKQIPVFVTSGNPVDIEEVQKLFVTQLKEKCFYTQYNSNRIDELNNVGGIKLRLDWLSAKCDNVRNVRIGCAIAIAVLTLQLAAILSLVSYVPTDEGKQAFIFGNLAIDITIAIIMGIEVYRKTTQLHRIYDFKDTSTLFNNRKNEHLKSLLPAEEKRSDEEEEKEEKQGLNL